MIKWERGSVIECYMKRRALVCQTTEVKINNV